MMYFSQRLRELRIEEGLTQKKLARSLGIKQASITDWELGKKEPRVGIVVDLAEFFRVSIEYMLGIENDDGTINSDNSLTKNEKKVLDDFNYLDEYAKEQVYIFLDTLVEAQKRRDNSNNNFTRKYK